MTPMRIDPRLQILYLLGVAIFAFAASHSLWLLGLLALQVALWLAAGFPVMGLVAIFRKLVVFFFAIVVSFAFFAAEPGDRYLSLFGWGLEVNLTGIVRGLLFSSRIVTVIYASRIIQRAGGRRVTGSSLRPSPIWRSSRGWPSSA
jgi:energy-coupling factor transporter transmembrane protein EcfT